MGDVREKLRGLIGSDLPLKCPPPKKDDKIMSANF